MRAKLSSLMLVAALLARSGISGEISASPGWSEVKVRVVEGTTGMPVPGARLQHLCTISPYYRHTFVADSNGVANVMIFRTWVGLSATGGQGLTNRLFISGTNEVARFCSDAVIRLKAVTHESRR